jgi:splicing factor 3B subunit 3
LFLFFFFFSLFRVLTLILLLALPPSDQPGRLLAGCGQTLRLYDLGQAKLLRKCELKAFPNHIMSLWIALDKIVVGDIQGSFFMVKHNIADNKYAVWLGD